MITEIEAGRRAFYADMHKAEAERSKPRVLIAGGVGVGKTSLINTLLGKKVGEVGHGEPTTMSFCEYEDAFVRVIDSRGFEPGDNADDYIELMRSEVARRRHHPSIDQHIHLILYCIAGVNARVPDTDLLLIREIFPSAYTLIVITKNDITSSEQRHAMLKRLTDNGVARHRIVCAAARPEDSGVKQLAEKCLALLPAAYRGAFIAKQQVDLEAKKILAEQIITMHATIAAGVGWVPVLDMAVIIPMQYRMVAKLAANYGFGRKEMTNMLWASGGVTLLGSAVAGGWLLDMIPIYGWLAGMANAFAITNAVGKLVNRQLIQYATRIIKEGADLADLPPLTITQDDLAAELANGAYAVPAH